MRLKSLNLKGFKSFADETEINFNENLIGVVGPNGSGKSNVVDSIRWVLGEQKTSELRLDSMTDVIFNGSKARKEGKVARVTLSFENTKNLLPTEYNEVSISRALYRDGTSEYRLNNVPCRKKDITNLFIDSGIGSNSYAIISLNMVEDILHDNGGYRRAMIEQAAGIAKYKVRKKETESKLKSTAEDLDRVEDILHEIKKNMSSFERQARRTEKFNKLKTEYREITIKLSKLEIRSLIEKLESASQKLQHEKDGRLHHNTQLNQKEANLEGLKSNIIEYEKSLSLDQQSYNAVIQELGQAENAKNLSLQTIRTAKEYLADIAKNQQDLTAAQKNAQKQLTLADGQIEKLQGDVNGQKTELQKVEVEHVKVGNLLSDLRRRERELINQINTNQNIRNSITREIEALAAKKSLLESDVEELNNRLKAAQNEIAEKSSLLENMQAQVEKAEKALKVSEEAVTTRQEKVENALQYLNNEQKKRSQLDVDISSIEQRIRFMTNIIEKNEGVPEAVKFVLKESPQKHHTIFSDAIAIKDEKYGKIIELFVEPYFHYLVVRERKEAERLSKLVKEAQKGKIHQFILEEVPEVDNHSIQGLNSIVDLLKIEPQMVSLVKWLMAKVYISDDTYDHDFVKSLPSDVTVLFPKDYVIWSRGQLYGGSPTLFEGVQLGRKQILEKLEKELEKFNAATITQDQKVVEAKQQLNDEQQALAQFRRTDQENRNQLESENRALFQLKSQITNIENNAAYISKQIDEKDQIIVKTINNLKVQQERLSELEANDVEELKDDELSNKIEEVNGNFVVLGQSKDHYQRELFEVQGKLDLAKKDSQYYQNTLSSVADRFTKMTSDQEIQAVKQKEAEEILANVSTTLETLYAKKKELQSQLSDREDSYYKQKGEIFELEKEINALRAKLSQKDQIVSQLNDQIAKMNFDKQSIMDRNSIEFGIELTDEEINAIPEDEGEEDVVPVNLEEMSNERRQLKDRIQSYGEINPMAITAYNEIKERYDQIGKERDDVLEAKKTLEETIQEIEKTASELFHEALAKIRANFQDVFQGLFSEDDSCDIVLLDNDNPLDAKVEIIAKPKGKRPKTISQLSGGEKTLTAASFLFALYLLKPAPFCIFDEVDAPLDDVNVQKFNKIIRQFSKDSQFIVITHNKLTMAEVDVLYGVFLKEQGVSGLSAVDFRAYDEAEVLTSAN